MRPVLKPALRRVWRDETTLQLGLTPRHAVLLAGADRFTSVVLDLLDGTRREQEVMTAAAQCGLPGCTEQVLELLACADALDDASGDTGVLAGLSRAERERLAPDLAGLTLAHSGPGAALAALRRRRQAVVHVHGGGRLGSSTAALLAAAGLGQVSMIDPEPVRPADLAPGGFSGRDLGRPRESAWRDLARRVAPSVLTAPLPGPPDLAVLVAEPGPADVGPALLTAGTPHLATAVLETTGLVGPLVLPGSTACRDCLDLRRADSDPTWPAVAAQLRTPAPDGAAQDVLLCAATAAQTALEVVAFLDWNAGGGEAEGGSAPASAGGTLEIVPPDWRFRRRSWAPHPDCACRFAVPAAEALPRAG